MAPPYPSRRSLRSPLYRGGRAKGSAIKHHAGATEQELRHLLAQADFLLTEDQTRKLWQFHSFLRAKNRELNLTRIINFGSIVRKHYIDSLFVAKIFAAEGIPFPEELLDLGSGAGFPGIPLAIYLPEQTFILAEGRQARARFLQQAIRLLGLANARVYAGRISPQGSPQVLSQGSAQDPGQGSSQEDFPLSAVITRAVEEMARTLQRVAPRIRRGGLVTCMKGPNSSSELKDVLSRSLPYELLLDHAYELPFSKDRRRLFVWRFLELESKGSPPARPASPARLTAEQASLPYGLSSNGPYGLSSSLSYGVSGNVPYMGRIGVEEAMPISSRDNPRFRLLQSLRRSKGIRKSGFSLLSGGRLVREAIQRYRQFCEALICQGGLQPPHFDRQMNRQSDQQFEQHFDRQMNRQLDQQSDYCNNPQPPSSSAPGEEPALPPELPCWFFSAPLFRELDIIGCGSPLLLIRTPPIPSWSPAGEGENRESEEPQATPQATGAAMPLAVALPLGDPENLGAALRSCAAFPPEQILLLREAAHPYHPRALRAAAAASLALPLQSAPSIEQWSAQLSAEQRSSLMALDPQGADINSVELPQRPILLLGQEGAGIPAHLSCQRVAIPTKTPLESLNSSVALGIALYILCQRYQEGPKAARRN